MFSSVLLTLTVRICGLFDDFVFKKIYAVSIVTCFGNLVKDDKDKANLLKQILCQCLHKRKSCRPTFA